MEELTTARKCVARWNASTVSNSDTRLPNVESKDPKGKNQEVGKPTIKEKEYSQETIEAKGLEDHRNEKKE